MVKADDGIKSSLKTTGLFGGVQIFKILIGIINTKIVAVLLGPLGIGILGLLNNTTGIISQITGLGLGTSAIRDVANSYANGDVYKFSKTVTAFRRLVWLTGSLGCISCIVLSPLLSKLTFGNFSYTLAFIFLSITLLFSQISSGQNVVLTGTKRFKDIAWAGILGSTIGLFITIPIYYIFREDGIVPVIIIQSITSLTLSFYFSRRVPVNKILVTWKEAFNKGSVMIKMGFFVALQGFWGMLFSYIVSIYISNTGGVADVGLYNSGFNIVTTYVGLVFSAMGTEYYPRLSTFSNNPEEFSKNVNQQIKISLMLVSPMIAAFLSFSDIAIWILYSDKFLSATNMIMFGIFGIFLKAPGWCLGFTFLAKGDTKAFFYNELAIQIFNAVANIIAYSSFGLTGLGISYIIGYIVYDIQCVIICMKRYNLKIDIYSIIPTIPQIIISAIILVVGICLSPLYKYSIGATLSILSFVYFYKEMSKIVDIKSYVLNKLNR